MDLRKDLLPPVLALTLSVGVHAGLAWLKPDLFAEAEPGADVSVVVEYLPAPPAAEPAPEASEPPPALPPPEPAEEPELPPAPEDSPPAAPAEAEPAPVPPAAAPEVRPDPSPPHEPAASPGPKPEAPPAPTLHDLLPRPAELGANAPPAVLPDPAGGEAREATLTLGDTDVRYRGYLDSVRGAIDRSWLWKEAILAAGRGGRVLVRFTLEAGGRPSGVEVAESSGSPLLDREAADTVSRAPFPPFPTHWTVERLNLFAQFNYRLE